MADVNSTGVINKAIAGLGLKQRIINKVAEWILPVYIVNDEAALVGVHPHGPIALSRGGATSTINLKGEISNNTQTLKAFSNGKGATAVTAGTGVTIGTVTSGKKLYVKTISLSTGTTGAFEIRDGSGGTIKATGIVTGNGMQTIPLEAPLDFSTGIFLDSSTSGNWYWTISGWEEDA